MEILTHCPVCGETKSKELFACTDFVASGESFKIVECPACSLQYTNPRPAEDEIGRYYQSDRYISHTGSNKSELGVTYKLYDWVRNYSIGNKLDRIKKYHKGGNLLDLGCGLGYFLHGAKEEGSFKVQGADVSEEAIQYVKSHFGLDVWPESALNTVEKGKFDVITQWHVLEHVHRLEERMQELKRILNDNGTMFIAVPNAGSFDAGFYKAFWDGYDVPRHIYHFTQKSFRHLMEKHGFEVVETLPMWFDGPYISMRSEYHQKNALGFLRGAFWGSVSTAKALITSDYSSLLFIVKHKKQ